MRPPDSGRGGETARDRIGHPSVAIYNAGMSRMHDEDRGEHQPGPGLGPPRFRLLTLFGLMTGISVVLAAYTAFGGFAAAIFALFLLAVFAHIAGNWLGTQLRDLGNVSRLESRNREVPRRSAGDVPRADLPSATHLSAQQPIPLWVKVSVLVGTVVGCVGGVALVLLWNVGPIPVLGLLFGALAFAVLGAIWSFALGAFIHFGWSAWRQAVRVDSEK